MAEEVIGLLFGVEGGTSIRDGSGKRIVDEITAIVNQINADDSKVPEIKLNFDASKAKSVIKDLEKDIKRLENLGKISITNRSGNTSGKQDGKNDLEFAAKVKKEMAEALAIQQKINKTKVTIGNLQLAGGNAKQVAEYTSQLGALEDQYEHLMHTFMSDTTGNAGEVPFDDIKDFSDQFDALEQAAQNTLKVSQARKADKEAATAQKKKYDELTASVKDYYKELNSVQKIEQKSNAVEGNKDTAWSTKDASYTQRIKLLNQLQQKYGELKVVEANGHVVSVASAKELGITEKQRLDLIKQIEDAISGNAVATEKSSSSIQAAWQKNSDKARAYVNDLRDIGSSDQDVIALTNELERLAMSADPKNLDELTQKMAQLKELAHKRGADIETFGHKLQRAFGSSLRSALVGIITTKIAQYIKEIYTNVVNLDKALVNLQIASGKTREETRELLKEYSKLAKQLGATTSEVADAADTWLRQGYSAEEANTLIANSMMLAKLGQMESAEASTALTSAMKGYNVAVEDSISIVDKFTKVDMEAAASAGDIATAMAETATSADIAGVSMDKLIGYITTVKEVTQDSAESVGVFYKTLFARMNNVAAGNFVDEETGESLNDVETVLNKLGIALRDVNGEFRDSDDVLDEVASKWETFDSVAQHAIATAFAGTRNQEKFLVLMQHYETALEYATIATESSGTAAEKYQAVLDGIEGKTNALKATFEDLSMTLLNSDIIAVGIDFLTLIIDGTNAIASFIDNIGGLPTAFLAVATAIAFTCGELIIYNAQLKVSSIYQIALSFLAKLKAGFINFIPALQNAKVAWQAYAAGTVSASTAMQASVPIIGWVLAAITALAGGLALYNGLHDDNVAKIAEAAEEAKALSEELSDLTNQYLELSEAVKTDEGVKNDLLDTQDALIKKLGLERYEVEQLINKYGSYAEAIKQASLEELRHSEISLRSDYDGKKDILEDEAGGSWFTPSFMQIDAARITSKPDRNNYDATAALLALEKSGYITAGDYIFAKDKNGNSYATSFNTSVSSKKKYNNFASTSDILRAYKDLENMMMLAQDTAGTDNFVYKALETEWLSMSDCIDEYLSSADALNDNLAQQYTLAGLINREMPTTQEAFNEYRQSVIDAAIASGEFVNATAEDIANLIDANLSGQNSFSKYYAESVAGTNNLAVPLKSTLEVLEQVQDGYDGLTKALAKTDEQGYLTADGLATLLQLEKDNALGGLELSDVLLQDANGYKIAEDALEKYIQALVTAYETEYMVDKVFASDKDRENALANLKTLQYVLMTLARTQEETADSSDTEREALEKQQDALNDQLDAYNELIDIRKDLLKTYEEEISYQKELEKRQRNVSSLQTKLAVARLDTSAAGQARVRELEAELREAEEDLEDFTLEHAIDVLTKQLESQNSEYESFIKRELDNIAKKIESLDTSPDITVDTSWVQDMLTQIATLISQVSSKSVENNGGNSGGGGAGSTTGEGAQGSTDRTSSSTLVEIRDNPLKDALGNERFDQIDGILNGNQNTGPASSLLSDYKDRLVKINDALVADNKANGRSANYWVSSQQWRAAFRGGLISNDIDTVKASYETLQDQFYKATGRMCTYHTGGIVGNIPVPSTSEEFAKLLKGEFVSTPAQMKRFMEETLPQITGYTASGGTNEFNAPLVEIHCDNVTSEALPKLKAIVDQAVKEVQKQLDSGMSRAGYKKTPTKRLT